MLNEGTFISTGQRIITTTRSHGTGLIQQTMDILKPDQILRVGGAGHKVIILQTFLNLIRF